MCHILNLIRSKRVLFCWIAFPCNTLSRARGYGNGPPAIRSDIFPLGLPNLSDADQAKVDKANYLAYRMCCIIRSCHRCGVPWAIENPGYSRLWLLPRIRRLIDHTGSSHVLVDFCQFGERWRKRTRLEFSHCDFDSLGVRCRPSNYCCNMTGKRHIELTGKTKSGTFLTRIAQAYPLPFCREVANIIKHLL